MDVMPEPALSPAAVTYYITGGPWGYHPGQNDGYLVMVSAKKSNVILYPFESGNLIFESKVDGMLLAG